MLSPPSQEIRTFPLELTDPFIFINCPCVCISVFSVPESVHKMSLQFISGWPVLKMALHLQPKCKNRVTQDHIWDRRRKSGAGLFSVKQYGLEFWIKRAEQWESGLAGCRSTWDQSRQLSGRSDFILQGLPLCQRATSAFVWVSAEEEAGFAFPCSQCFQHQYGSLWWGIQDILTVSVSTEAASWWRMSKESQTDKREEWCPCVSSLCQINGPDMQLCVCLHKGTQSLLWYPSTMPTGRK